jgi:hypothetical protein
MPKPLTLKTHNERENTDGNADCSYSFGDTELDTDVVRVVEYPGGRSGPAVSIGDFSGTLQAHATLIIKSGDFDIVFASGLFVGGLGFVMSYQVSILLHSYFSLLPSYSYFALLHSYILHSYLCTPILALLPTLHYYLSCTPALSCHIRLVLILLTI